MTTSAEREEEAARITAGLADARAILADMFHAHTEKQHRDRCLVALKAVISAERTTKAADAYVARPCAKTRKELRGCCSLRVSPHPPTEPEP